MQSIIIEKPYRFIPPLRGTLLPYVALKFRVNDWYLRRYEGIESHEIRGAENLQESLRQGHSLLLAPNHPRCADPVTLSFIARHFGIYPFMMASWHLFHESPAKSLAMRALGAFSIYREGIDRQSLDTAIDILTQAKRPLVIFPEGAVFRTNDRLQELLDGVSLIARTAAKRRAKESQGAKVVIHPVAIKYVPMTSVAPMVEEILSDVERRLTWNSQDAVPKSLVERARRAMHGLLCLKEIEYLGAPQTGTWDQRQEKLVDCLLNPIEQNYLGRNGSGAIIPRIKTIRMKLLPELLQDRISEETRKRIWQQLAKVYLAQQIASYPHDYLDYPTTEARLLETVERLHEDLTDIPKKVGPLKAITEIGPPIIVPTEKARGEGEVDVMRKLQSDLQGMLERLSTESRRVDGADSV